MRRTNIIIAMFACTLLLCSWSINLSAEKNYNLSSFQTKDVQHQPVPINFSPDATTTMSLADFLEAYRGESDKSKRSPDDSALHPALGYDGSAYVVRMYEIYAPSDRYIFVYRSDDDGANFEGNCWIDMNGASYSSIDYWGSGTQFFGTFLPPSDYVFNPAFMLLDMPDPMNCTSWNVTFSSLVPSGFDEMRMIEIAADNNQQSWNWGFESAIISGEPLGTPEIDVPVLFGHSAPGSPYGYFFPTVFENCRTTGADIDPTTGKAYAVYDRYDTVDDQYQMLVWQVFYYDWSLTCNSAEIIHPDPDLHIRYPVVCTYDDNVLVVAAAYHDSDPANFQLICFCTDDGDVDNLTISATIASTPLAENYPDISHIEDDLYVVVYYSDDNIYASWTGDAGLTWSAPVQINDPALQVYGEYRFADIGDGGTKVGFEYVDAGEVKIHWQDLPVLDTDGDGVAFFADNCPDDYNPLQINDDTDEWGNACDNCPNDDNSNQLDSDGDGAGNACDVCPFDEFDDADNDGHCADVDNCPDDNNPTQANDDTDEWGNECDNCPNDDNPDQADNDDDGDGDVCDDDDDNDGHPDGSDNCQYVYNPLQIDSDTDGIGDACEFICGDANNDDVVDISDAVYLVNFVFIPGAPAPDPIDAGKVNCDSVVDISDAVYLVNFVFVPLSPVPCDCP